MKLWLQSIGVCTRRCISYGIDCPTNSLESAVSESLGRLQLKVQCAHLGNMRADPGPHVFHAEVPGESRKMGLDSANLTSLCKRTVISMEAT